MSLGFNTNNKSIYNTRTEIFGTTKPIDTSNDNHKKLFDKLDVIYEHPSKSRFLI